MAKPGVEAPAPLCQSVSILSGGEGHRKHELPLQNELVARISLSCDSLASLV
jgi:hypothetical protein